VLLMAVELSLTGYIRQLLASRGVRMAADPWPEGGVYEYINNFYVRADPAHATLLVPGAPEDRPRARAECVWRPFSYEACAGVGWAFNGLIVWPGLARGDITRGELHAGGDL
jgi:hypothetical protein